MADHILTKIGGMCVENNKIFTQMLEGGGVLEDNKIISLLTQLCLYSKKYIYN